MYSSTWKADLLYLPLHIWIRRRDGASPLHVSLSIIKLLALINQCIHRRALSLQHFKSQSHSRLVGRPGPVSYSCWLRE